jgi:hypothetical protein
MIRAEDLPKIDTLHFGHAARARFTAKYAKVAKMERDGRIWMPVPAVFLRALCVLLRNLSSRACEGSALGGRRGAGSADPSQARDDNIGFYHDG